MGTPPPEAAVRFPMLTRIEPSVIPEKIPVAQKTGNSDKREVSQNVMGNLESLKSLELAMA